MTFQHDLPLGPCAYPGHINTAPACTTSLKLVLVFVLASNPLLSHLPSSLRKVLIDKNLYHPGLSVRQSSSCLSHFFSIAYWEDISLFVSIACPRSREKGVHLCWASILNMCSWMMLWAFSSCSCHSWMSEAVATLDELRTGFWSVPIVMPKTFSAQSFAEMQTFQIS